MFRILFFSGSMPRFCNSVNEAAAALRAMAL